jgi:hypothetical protein
MRVVGIPLTGFTTPYACAVPSQELDFQLRGYFDVQ